MRQKPTNTDRGPREGRRESRDATCLIRWCVRLSLAALLAAVGAGARAQQREDPTWGNLMDQSKARQRARQYEAALGFARAAEARARAITRGPDLTVALSLMGEAEAEGRLGQLDAAARALNDALTITRAASGPRSTFAATVLNMLSNLYFNNSQLGKAGDYLQQSIELATAANDLRMQAVDWGNMGWLQINLLDYPKALNAVERSIALFRRLNAESDLPHQYRTVSHIRVAMGDIPAAEEAIRQALGIDTRVSGRDDLGTATDYCSLGEILLVTQRTEEGFHEYDVCLDIRQRLVKPNDPIYGIVAETLEGIANAYAGLGDHPRALALFERAREIRVRMFGADSIETALVDVSIAGQYWAQDNWQRALAVLGPASKVMKMKNASTRNKQGSLALLGDILLHVKQTEYKQKAVQVYRELIDEQQRAGQWPAYGESLQFLAVACLKVNDRACAMDALTRALANQRRLYREPSIAVGSVHMALGSTYYWFHEYDQAAREFGTAFDQWRQLKGPDARSPFSDSETNTYIDSLWRMKLAADANASPAYRQRLVDLSFEISQLSYHSTVAQALSQLAARVAAGNDQIAVTMKAEQDLSRARDGLQKDYAGVIAGAGDQDQERKLDALRSQIADVERRRQQARSFLAARLPAYRALTDAPVLNIANVQHLLANDQVLVAFNFGPQCGFVWGVSPTGAVWAKIDLTGDQLADEVRALRNGLDVESRRSAERGFDETRSRAGPAFDRARAYTLYQALLGSVQPLLNKASHLMFVPVGALESLPPSVLVTEPPKPTVAAPTAQDLRSTAWLIRQKAITIVPSLQALTALGRIQARQRPAPLPFLGIGEPALAGFTALGNCPSAVASRQAKALASLHPVVGARKELVQISASLRGRPEDLLTDTAATESNLRRLDLGAYRVLAFSTHGLVPGEADLTEPALVITPPTQCVPDAGLLTASKISQLSLDADWVVLSACNTASGDGSPHAQGLSGLARAFFYAGARNVLVSHWSVKNDAAVALTTRTFAALANRGLDKAEALRRAILSLIDDTAHPEFSHPSYWGPFVLVGGSDRAPATR